MTILRYRGRRKQIWVQFAVLEEQNVRFCIECRKKKSELDIWK